MDLTDFENRSNKFNEYLSKLSDKEIKEHNEKKIAKDKQDFTNFEQALSGGICYYCKYPIAHFSEKKPCFHWLLKPKGFKKRHFPILFKIKSFHEINSYLRWTANTQGVAKNINDLEEEKNPSKVIEETIRYKNLEWSFSCSKTDREGHKDKHEGKEPHYHFEMKVDGLVIINFNGFHVPFHTYDEYCFAMKDGKFPRASYHAFQGAGMQDFYDSVEAEKMLEYMHSTDEEEKAEFKLDTFVQADQGFKISGDDIYEIIQESKRTGAPIAKLIKKLKNVKIITTISPGPGIPEISKRNQR